MYSDTNSPIDYLANRFRLLGQPSRLRILLAIGPDEACVCHLEACLGYRQAYISQQLMILRDAGLVSSRRTGKHIYYTLLDSSLLDLVNQAALQAGLGEAELQGVRMTSPVEGCTCPHCHAGQDDHVSSENELLPLAAAEL